MGLNHFGKDRSYGVQVNYVKSRCTFIAKLETGSDREQRDDARRVYDETIRQIPADWEDVTSELSGTQFAIIGNVFPKPKR